jgi:hypothetical protein
LGRKRVVWAEGRLPDAQRPLVQRQRLGGSAKFRQRPTHAVEVGGDVGVIRAERHLVDAQRPLVQGQRLGGSAKLR